LVGLLFQISGIKDVKRKVKSKIPEIMSTFNFSSIADRFSEDASVSNTTLSAMLSKVYWWMTLSLILTGFTAFAVSRIPALIELIYTKSFVLYTLIGVQLVLAFLFIGLFNKLSFTAAGIFFALYSLLTGVMFSSILFCLLRNRLP
jgi:FtsH-binding integral membrane protein